LHTLHTLAVGGGSELMGVPGDEEDVMGLIVGNSSNEEIPLGASVSAGERREKRAVVADSGALTLVLTPLALVPLTMMWGASGMSYWYASYALL